MKSYVHIFDTCTQDWFSVASILQNVLTTINKENPSICKAYVRSDEAGCFHCNMLIAARKNIFKSTGIQSIGYHFFEPQNGKDICDRIISPLKSALKRYCDEGNDILCARDMYTALRDRPVRGVTACVAVIEEDKNTLEVEKIERFSTFHNFQYERNHLCVWRAYGIGQGRRISLKSFVKKHLSKTTLLHVTESQQFFPSEYRKLDRKSDSASSKEESDVRSSSARNLAV